jgi:ribonuclease P protein component
VLLCDYVYYLSTQEAQTKADTWFFGAQTLSWRTACAYSAAKKRKKSFICLTGTVLLPKQHRLKARGDFQGVFAAHKKARLGPFTVLCRRNNLSCSRFGFVVSTSVSKKAVSRNVIRRQLHEIVYTSLPRLRSGHDCIVRVFPEALHLSYKEKEHTLGVLFVKLGLFLSQ